MSPPDEDRHAAWLDELRLLGADLDRDPEPVIDDPRWRRLAQVEGLLVNTVATTLAGVLVQVDALLLWARQMDLEGVILDGLHSVRTALTKLQARDKGVPP
jgi:hypothetical protein